MSPRCAPRVSAFGVGTSSTRSLRNLADHTGRYGFIRELVDQDYGTGDAVFAVRIAEQRSGGSQCHSRDVFLNCPEGARFRHPFGAHPDGCTIYALSRFEIQRIIPAATVCSSCCPTGARTPPLRYTSGRSRSDRPSTNQVLRHSKPSGSYRPLRFRWKIRRLGSQNR
jgi:hypothetical protein